MNILTKICVVVLVVVAVFISAAVITHANVSGHWKQEFEKEHAAKEVADVMAANSMIHAASLQAKMTDMDRQNRELVGAKDAEITRLKTDVGTVTAEKSSQQTALQGLVTQIAGLRSDVQAMQASREKMQESLSAAQKELASAQEKMVDLEAKLGQRDADIKRYDGQLKVLRTDNANLREQAEKLEAQLAKGGAAVNTEDVQPVAPANVRGRVTAVQGDILSINVGSAKGVREGMLLVIHRGDKLVGYLRIDETEVDRAVGVIVEKNADPQQGDGVMPKDI